MSAIGVKFIDQSQPDELVHLVNSAYLSLCSSHQLGGTKLDDISKLSAIVLQCESDFLGKSTIRIDQRSLRDALVVICMVGMVHGLRLWDGINWGECIKKVAAPGTSEFQRRLFSGLEIEKKPSVASVPKGKRRQPRAST